MGRAHYDVLIAGGGTAGVTVAARLRKKQPGLKIAVIEPSERHFYQPLWTLVGGGILSREKTARSQKKFIPRGCEWIKEKIVSFNPEKNEVALASGSAISYDSLVVALGLQTDWEKVKGLAGNLGRNGICSNYSYESVPYTWECIQNFKGGNAIFTFPNTPVKCGGAPQKIMYLAEDYFRKNGVRDKAKVMFRSAAATIFAVPKYANALTEIIAKREIEATFKSNLVEVNADAKTATFENVDTKELTTFPFEMIHVTPPMSGPDVVKRSTLANAAGWVDVNKATLQHVRYPNVFSLGDASSLPTSKTGAAVRMQAPVLVKNLMALREGRELVAHYNGYTSCPLVTGYGKLILAEFDYDGTPQETFPFDQSKERLSMYLLKKHVLPPMYWKGMLKGRL